jgi:hypothetical protein
MELSVAVLECEKAMQWKKRDSLCFVITVVRTTRIQHLPALPASDL